MPISKTSRGGFAAILSDTSIDRDDEFMTDKLIESWALNKSLPALMDHDNNMGSFVGGWQNIKTIKYNGRTALSADPFFFSGDANPKAPMLKKLIEEACDAGLNPGISIGAIPHDYIEKEINGKMHRGWTNAELVEASWTPIPSNRNATYASIAKSFNIELTKPAKVEECVRSLMSDPDFKPQEGRTKEESAYAVCNSKLKTVEANKMSDDQTVPAANAGNNTVIEKNNAVDETKNAILELQKGMKALSEENANLKKTLESRSVTLKSLREQMPTQDAPAAQTAVATIKSLIIARTGLEA